ncbi:MAG: hypothetical protein LBL45_10460, partial [Treponema sp.]|nr:hypothetical protein [Treponema sp.]
TTYSYTNENGKLIYRSRDNRTPNQIRNLLGDIASGYLQPVITQDQDLRVTSLASGSMSGMNRNMKNLTLDSNQTRVGLPLAQSPKHLESKLIRAQNRLATRVVVGGRNHSRI